MGLYTGSGSIVGTSFEDMRRAGYDRRSHAHDGANRGDPIVLFLAFGRKFLGQSIVRFLTSEQGGFPMSGGLCKQHLTSLFGEFGGRCEEQIHHIAGGQFVVENLEFIELAIAKPNVAKPSTEGELHASGIGVPPLAAVSKIASQLVSDRLELGG